MDLQFEIGNQSSPLGHALIYFTVPADGVFLATYVFVPPISFDFEKYVPPAFASMLPGGQMNLEIAAPIPPVAEEVQSLEWLRAQALARNDDLVHAGSLFSRDLPNVAGMTQDAAGEYARLYRERQDEQISVAFDSTPDYANQTEQERLAQMTSLVGRLRDALGTDEAEELRREIERIATTLPAKYRAWEVADAASEPGESGQRLASLHLSRCYLLLREQYLEVADIERQITELHGS